MSYHEKCLHSSRRLTERDQLRVLWLLAGRTDWPTGIHRTIATEAKLPPSAVYGFLYVLRERRLLRSTGS